MAEQVQDKDGGDDLAILFPERQASIAGMLITMREYRWVEGLRLQALIAPIVEQLASLAEQGRLMESAALDALFGDHADALPLLIATACDQPVEWVAALSDRDGRNLRLLWWTVNVPFFVRHVTDCLLARQLAALDGATSSPASPAPDTTPSGSATTRVVN